jgi:hypothetical protein
VVPRAVQSLAKENIKEIEARRRRGQEKSMGGWQLASVFDDLGYPRRILNPNLSFFCGLFYLTAVLKLGSNTWFIS